MARKRTPRTKSAPSGIVTTTDVAVYVGVARPTVSTILSGCKSNTRVSDKLRQRVLEAAAELGYRPNAAARAIRSGKFGAIGIIQSADSSRGGIHPVTLFAIETRAAEHDMHLSLGIVLDDDLTDPATLPKVVREWCVDGLLISYTADVPPMMIEHIRQRQLPAIWMNVKMERDCVHLDDFGACLGATDILLDLGHRRIAYLGLAAQGAHYSIADRYRGYTKAMTTAGLTPVTLFRQALKSTQMPDPAHAVQPIVELFRRPDRPTAVVTTLDVADVFFAAHLAGLKVPDDLSVIAVTEGVLSALGVRPAQMRLHNFGMGYRSFEMLQRKMRSPDEVIEPTCVYSTFERGQTLMPPKQN